MADTEWPSYELPEGIGGAAPAGPPTGETTSGTPATPTGEGVPGSDTQVTAPGTAEPPAPADDSLSIPKYRFDEVNRGYQELSEQNRQLLTHISQLTQVLNRQAAPAAPAAPPVQLDEREQRIVAELDRLLQHSPTWQRLAPFMDKADVLMQLAEEIPAQRQSEAQHWKGVAHQWLANVLDAGAKTFMGPQARVDQLEPERADIIRRSFTTYVSSDPQRVARYESGDRTLVNDFIGWFRGWVAGGVDPQARRTAAAQQSRAEAVRKLPTSGSAGQPVTSAPPKVNNSDEEAVHSAGWQAFQREVAASR